jgi:hypothetical protein
LKFIFFGPFILIFSIIVDLLVFFLNLFSFPEIVQDNITIGEQGKYSVILSEEVINIYLEAIKET